MFKIQRDGMFKRQGQTRYTDKFTEREKKKES